MTLVGGPVSHASGSGCEQSEGGPPTPTGILGNDLSSLGTLCVGFCMRCVYSMIIIHT